MMETVRVRLSAGLLVAIVLHAAVFGVISTVGQTGPQLQQAANWSLPTASQVVPGQDSPTVGSPYTGYVQPLPQPANVNLAAQGEAKQASPPGAKQQCVPCQPNRAPSYYQPQPTYSQPVVMHDGIIRLNPGERLLSVNPVTTPATAAASPAKLYEIALFLDGSAKSQTLASWFQSDTQLLAMRKNCQFQTYTSANAIYKTRFAQAVPVDQFPVVLLLDKHGGHIHAAGGNMIPSTPAELVDDFREGFKLYKEAKAAAGGVDPVKTNGAIKTAPYGWDDRISPNMQLHSYLLPSNQLQDCSGGQCTPVVQPANSGAAAVVDSLFGKDAESNLSKSYQATMLVYGLAAAFGLILLTRRLKG